MDQSPNSNQSTSNPNPPNYPKKDYKKMVPILGLIIVVIIGIAFLMLRNKSGSNTATPKNEAQNFNNYTNPLYGYSIKSALKYPLKAPKDGNSSVEIKISKVHTVSVFPLQQVVTVETGVGQSAVLDTKD